MNGHFNKLEAHSQWADAKLWTLAQAAWEGHFDEVRERLHHWHLTQRGFVDVLSGAGGQYIPPEAFEDAAALMAYAQETHECWDKYLSSDLDVGVDVVIPWIADEGEEPFSCKVREAMTQAMMHSQHHRGQLATRLRDWGFESVSTDFIYWLHMGQPAADWPSMA